MCIFGESDEIAKCDADVHNLAFAMAVTKKNEFFDEFYTCFSAAIVPIGFVETPNLSTFERFLTPNSHSRILVGTRPSSYRYSVERLRRNIQGMRNFLHV